MQKSTCARQIEKKKLRSDEEQSEKEVRWYSAENITSVCGLNQGSVGEQRILTENKEVLTKELTMGEFSKHIRTNSKVEQQEITKKKTE